MAKIRGLFHKVGNWHNKISVSAGLAKLELRQKLKGHTIPKEIKKITAKLSNLERYAIEASKTLNQLKAVVYDKVDPDTNKPRNERGQAI